MLDVASLSAWDFWFWSTLLELAFLGTFYFAFRSLTRARIIEDTPTSRIRSAHQGYVELRGITEYLDGQPLTTPLTNKPCCWYRYSIQKRSDKNWRTVESEVSSAPFLLRDETGVCVIDPEGAEANAELKKVWHGSTRRPPGAAAPSSLIGRPARGLLLDGLKPRTGLSLNLDLGLDLTTDMGSGYRYSEEWIPEGSPLYALGMFRSLDEMDHRESRREIMLELLRQWKQDPEGLLARFDRNRNGRIDPHEWERAREAARQEATEVHRSQMESRIIHTLGRTGSRRQPFLLSTREQRPLARRYRIAAAASLAGSVLTGALAVSLVMGRLLG